MSTVTASTPNGSERVARSGLHGSSATTPSFPIGTSRQLKVGLQPASALAAIHANAVRRSRGGKGIGSSIIERARSELKSAGPLNPSSMKKVVCTAAVAIALAVGVGVYLSTGVSAAPASTFVLLDGSKQSTEDPKGKVTLGRFWATSCVTCVAEMPKVIATYDKYQARGYDTLAVAMSYDPPSYVVNFAETRKLPFKVAIDNTGTVAKAWR